MRVLFAVLILLLSACTANIKPSHVGTTEPGTVDGTTGIYLPKHPDLAFDEPVFSEVAPEIARAAYAASDKLFRDATNPSFNAVVLHAAGAYISAHLMQAIACADSKGWPLGPGVAPPECIWEVPYSNDWVGCMALQFPPPADLAALNYDDNTPLYIWIDRNYDIVTDLPAGPEFLRQINGTEKLGAQCEATLRHPDKGGIDL
jgi:hypothetical protein